MKDIIDTLSDEELDLLNSDPEMLAAFKAKYQSGSETPLESNPTPVPEESRAKSFVRKVANALPTAGGIGGGLALGIPGTVFGMGVGGIPAAAAGAGIGAAGGEGIKQLILRGLGDQTPATPLEAATDIVKEGGKAAATTYLGGRALQGAGKLGKVVFAKSVPKASAGIEAAEKAAGIHVPTVPTNVPLGPRQVLNYTEEMSQYLSKTPEQLSKIADPKFLNEQRSILKNILDKIPEESRTQTGAVLARLKDHFGKTIEIAKPGIAPAKEAFKNAKTKEAILKGLKGTAKAAAKVAIGGGVAGATVGGLSKLGGN